VTLTKYPTATDNCDGPITGATSAPLAYFEKGTYAIIWEFRDETGNTSTQTQSVVVADNQAPVPDVGSLPALNGSCSVPITQFPTATDNCKGTIVATTTDPLVYSATGNDTINWRFDDGNGNIAVQPQTVTITDHTPPVPDVAALPVIQSDCRAYICSKPTATDDCKGKIVASTADPLFYVNKGAYTLHWTYSDGNGNTSSQTQTVIVADNTAPVPDAAQLPVIQGNCCISVCTKPTATDNCRGRVIGATSDPLFYSQKGTYAIHWTFNDGNGNTSSQTQTVIVADNTPPVPNVNPLPPITGSIHCGKCSTVRCYPSATDNCKGRIVGTTASPLTYCYRGNFVIVWKYNDGNGNITTQNQTVYIR
jgi:glutamine cyclotransferase